MDRRAAPIRWFIERRAQIKADAGEDLPAVLESAIDRFVFLEGRVLALEAAALRGDPVDLQDYIASVGTLMRLADRIGYTRRAKPVLSLREIAAQAQSEGAAP